MPTAKERFHNNLLRTLEHFEYLMDKCYQHGLNKLDPSLARAGINIINSMQDKEFIVNKFVENTEGDWDKILKKDEDWLLNDIGKFINMSSIQLVEPQVIKDGLLYEVNGKRLITQQDKDRFWTLLHSLIKISIKHLHHNGYKRDFDSLAKKWGIQSFE